MKLVLKIVAGLVLLVLLAVVVLVLTPTRWIADRLETTGSDLLGAEISIGSLSLDLLNGTPSVELKNLKIEDTEGSPLMDAGATNVSVVLSELFKGNLVFDDLKIIDSNVNLSVDNDGVANWKSLTPFSKQAQESETNKEASDVSLELPVVRKLNVENSTISYEDLSASRQATLTISATGSTVADSIDTEVQINGKVNGAPVSMDAKFSPVSSFVSKDVPIFLNLSSQVGDSSLDVDGSVGNLQEFRDLDLTFELDAPSVEDFARLSGIRLPVIPALQVSSKIERDGDDYILRRFDGLLGDSDLNGDVRIDVTTSPATLYANVISNVLDLDDLAGFFGGQPDPDDGNVEDQRIETEDTDGLLLPDKALNIKTMTEALSGAIRFRALSVDSEVWPLEAIDTRIEFNNQNISISEATINAAGGDVFFSADLDTSGVKPTGPVELRLQSINLRELMIAIGIDDDSFGTLGGRAKFWITGDTVSDIMASADGGIFLLMTGGRLDALLAELAGVDLVESLTVLMNSGEPTAQINCGYFDIHAKSGIAKINRFVLDTDDTLFMATGAIDFNSESLDLILEPHPKDVSLLSAQTSVNINGTLLEPSLTPGSALATRVMAAAALAALATPLAAIIPFVQSGTGDDSAYCDGLTTKLDKAR